MKTYRLKNTLALLLAALLILSSCATTGQGAANGAFFGGVLGSAVGGLTGGHRGHFAGTIVGTLIGGAAGAAIGAHNERERIEQIEHRGNSVYNQNSRRSTGRDNREYSTNRYENVASSPLTIRALRFVGQDGNNAINRGETCQIIFELCNTTGRTINDIIPDIYEVNGNSHLTISPATRIEGLRSGDAIRYTASVRADNRIKEGTAYFRIAVSTDGSEFITLRDFSIQMQK